MTGILHDCAMCSLTIYVPFLSSLSFPSLHCLSNSTYGFRFDSGVAIYVKPPDTSPSKMNMFVFCDPIELVCTVPGL